MQRMDIAAPSPDSSSSPPSTSPTSSTSPLPNISTDQHHHPSSTSTSTSSSSSNPSSSPTAKRQKKKKKHNTDKDSPPSSTTASTNSINLSSVIVVEKDSSNKEAVPSSPRSPFRLRSGSIGSVPANDHVQKDTESDVPFVRARSNSTSAPSTTSPRTHNQHTTGSPPSLALSPRSFSLSSGGTAATATATTSSGGPNASTPLLSARSRQQQIPASSSSSSTGLSLLTLRRQPPTKLSVTGEPLNPTRLAELEVEMSKEYFLNCILRDEHARTIFLQFLRKRHCAENLLFWLEVEDYMKLEAADEMETRARSIYDQYIKVESPYEVNLSHKLREEVELGMNNPERDTFVSAQKAIFLLLVHGTFDYFLRSDLYKMYKENRDIAGLITARQRTNSLVQTDEEAFELAAAAVAANKGCCILS